jgi:hypothetical protein
VGNARIWKQEAGFAVKWIIIEARVLTGINHEVFCNWSTSIAMLAKVIVDISTVVQLFACPSYIIVQLMKMKCGMTSRISQSRCVGAFK